MEKICSKCGTSNEESAKFCVSCAAEFAAVVADDTVGPASSESVQSVETEEPVQVETPAEVQAEVQAEVPAEVQAEVPAETPAEAPQQAPVVKAPAEVPQQAPVYAAVPPQGATYVEPQIQEPIAVKPVPVIAWLGLFLLRIVPLGAIIEIIIAMTSKNKSLSNYGKAKLIFLIVGIILAIVFVITMFSLVEDMIYEIQDAMDSYM
ncbi:MAG: zinc-ribbon domain-containing protein [Vallitaleaceae bacterium]|jgi:hypothetical protein|nr:zinc-ribbon domain-containing protein [Vallitaleaceae bacterium]